MMPAYFTPQGPAQMVPVAAPGQHHECQHPHAADTSTPTKRPAGDHGGHGGHDDDGDDGDDGDDDIQFISEKPVKRLRMSERPAENPPMPQLPIIPFPAGVVPNNVPVAQMDMVPGDLRDAERRLSTGMVGLPSDLHAMELTYALRGVSMPVLEKFVLNQPSRKPRPLSPPELSPKQLPSTVPPAAKLNVPTDQPKPTVPGLPPTSNPPIVRPSPSPTSHQAGKQATTPTPNVARNAQDSSQGQVAEPQTSSRNHPTPCCSDHAPTTYSKGATMPRPPTHALSRPEASQHMPHPESNPRPTGNHNHNHNHNHHQQQHHHHNGSVHPPKQPCQSCSRLRHQAQLTRAQGMPIVNGPLSHHFMPQGPYPQAYSQQIHPQMLAMAPSNLHQFGPNFAQVMMPINNNPFAPLPPHTQQHQHQQPPPPPPPPVKLAAPAQPQTTPMTDKQPNPEATASGKANSPPRRTSHPSNTQTAKPDPKTTSQSPGKPATSVAKPTYRKPSPNLVVDVAETCQEIFPFDEVAKRHNVSVEKVLEVFAAIIQVPLLRCPTDRRRAGRLATARIKEYNKAKKAINDGKADGGGSKVEKPPSSKEIAKRLGQTEVPGGLSVGEKS